MNQSDVLKDLDRSAIGAFERMVLRFKTMENMLVIEQKLKSSLTKHENKYMKTPISSSDVEANKQNQKFEDWGKKITIMETKIEELKFIEESFSNIKDMETMRSVLLRESQVDLEHFKKWVENNSKTYKEMEEIKKALVNVPTGPISFYRNASIALVLCACNKNCTTKICSDCKKKGYSCASTCDSSVQAYPNKPDNSNKNSGFGAQNKRRCVGKDNLKD